MLEFVTLRSEFCDTYFCVCDTHFRDLGGRKDGIDFEIRHTVVMNVVYFYMYCLQIKLTEGCDLF